jgi:[ribosomal protein S5]-alanine N-acetyltransferase
VTRRLELASLTEDRRAQVLEASRRSVAFQRPWVQPPTTDPDYHRLLERQATDEFEGFLFIRRADDELVGMCNISQIIRGNFNSAFIGFGAVKGFSRQGYMREGIGLVLDRAFGSLRLHRIEANVQPANEPSRALVRSLGFAHEGFAERYLKVGGRWRDHEHWAIRAETWRRH